MPAQVDTDFVEFVRIQTESGKTRCLSKQNRKHARSQRIERAGMSGLDSAEDAGNLVDGMAGCPPLGFVQKYNAGNVGNVSVSQKETGKYRFSPDICPSLCLQYLGCQFAGSGRYRLRRICPHPDRIRQNALPLQAESEACP